MQKLFSLVLALWLAATAPLSAKDKFVRTDDTIMDEVRRRLANDADVKGGTMDVSVKDGVVMLKGNVRSDKLKERAEKLTKKVRGVKKVDNELKVGPM